MDGEVSTLDRVVERLTGRLTELHVDMADIPLLQYFLRESVNHLQSQLGLIRHSKGVSKIGGIVRREIIIAVVAEEGADTVALAVEGSDTEGIALGDECLLTGGVDELLQRVGKADIGQRVDGKERIESDGITEFALLGILHGHRLVGHFTTEIAVVAKHRCGYRGTQGRIHLTHQHGGLTE